MISIEEHQRTLLAAQGYCELGMIPQALQEIASIPEELQNHPLVVELRLVVLMQAKNYKASLAVAQELIKLAPDKNMGYIHAAFCLHELGRTQAARDALLEGPPSLHSEPVYHYNLACYECALDHLELARLHLQKAIELDRKFRDYAKTDPDLKPLHP